MRNISIFSLWLIPIIEVIIFLLGTYLNTIEIKKSTLDGLIVGEYIDSLV